MQCKIGNIVKNSQLSEKARNCEDVRSSAKFFTALLMKMLPLEASEQTLAQHKLGTRLMRRLDSWFCAEGDAIDVTPIAEQASSA